MLTASQISKFKTTVAALEDLATELSVISDKTGQVAVAVYDFSQQIGLVLNELVKPDYTDTCPAGHIIKRIISGESVTNMNISEAKTLKKYVVIECVATKFAPAGTTVDFKHVGAKEPVVYKNKHFDGIRAHDFKPGQFYLIVDESIGRRHVWKYMKWLSGPEAVRVCAALKKPVGTARYKEEV